MLVSVSIEAFRLAVKYIPIDRKTLRIPVRFMPWERYGHFDRMRTRYKNIIIL